jgi:transposase
MSVSFVARTHGLSPSLLFKWRQRMAESGREAVRADDVVVGAARVRQLEERIRELERLLGRKTLEVQRQRFQIHYTPPYASWLNQVERWFALVSSREIRRGSFASAKDLVARITAFVAAYNARSRPFAWTATADDILAKLARVCNVISGTPH